MALLLEVPAQYGDARECIEAAHRNLEQVRQLLTRPSVENADASAAILREVEVQLGCIAALWKAEGANRRRSFATCSQRKLLQGDRRGCIKSGA